jgi:hypothetical protein
MNANLKTSLITVVQFIVVLILLFGVLFFTLWLYSINPKLLRFIVGILLVFLGVFILLFGDKKLNVKDGVILKIFSPPNYPAGLIKWGAGLVAILIGMSLIVNRF